MATSERYPAETLLECECEVFLQESEKVDTAAQHLRDLEERARVVLVDCRQLQAKRKVMRRSVVASKRRMQAIRKSRGCDGSRMDTTRQMRAGSRSSSVLRRVSLLHRGLAAHHIFGACCVRWKVCGSYLAAHHASGPAAFDGKFAALTFCAADFAFIEKVCRAQLRRR